MQRHRLIELVALTSALPVLTARAQAPAADSTGFRAGQWGAELSLGSNLGNTAGAGALRFHTARRALLLDMTRQVLRQSGDAPLSQTETFGRLRLGTRWYRPVTRQVLQSFTVGVLVSRDQREQQQLYLVTGESVQSRFSSTGGGLFAELGGT